MSLPSTGEGGGPQSLPGIHHVTAITGVAQRNVDFYVGVLGLRFVKRTVNFDMPDTYHLYFGDRLGTPGTAMTFFVWPDLPPARPGSGQVSAVAFAVPRRSLDFWAERLRRLRVPAAPQRRLGDDVLTLEDPDGVPLELVGGPWERGWAPWEEGPVDPAHAVRGFHSVTLRVREEAATARVLVGTMGFRELGREGSRARFETGAGGPGALVDVLLDPGAPRGEETTGTVHHVAWRALDESHQLGWRQALVRSGLTVTPVIDRSYFRSIYYREPGGVLFEIATDGPGFTVDEPPEALGSKLQLPPQYEGLRASLERELPPLAAPAPLPSAPAEQK